MGRKYEEYQIVYEQLVASSEQYKELCKKLSKTQDVCVKNVGVICRLINSISNTSLDIEVDEKIRKTTLSIEEFKTKRELEKEVFKDRIANDCVFLSTMSAGIATLISIANSIKSVSPSAKNAVNANPNNGMDSSMIVGAAVGIGIGIGLSGAYAAYHLHQYKEELKRIDEMTKEAIKKNNDILLENEKIRTARRKIISVNNLLIDTYKKLKKHRGKDYNQILEEDRKQLGILVNQVYSLAELLNEENG